MHDDLRKELNDLRTASLYRELAPVRLMTPTRGYVRGKEAVLFCTNNYLGLTHHPEVIEASIKATETFGTGSGSSRLISGHSELYEDLEAGLAKFKNTEKALVFSSGYLANLGAVTALAGRSDTIYSDRFAHASLVDACVLSRAAFKRFGHNDPQSLRGLVSSGKESGKRLIVTEGIFSMDGDIAPLGEYADIASRHECLLIVDDAHGTGVIGRNGKGTADHLDVSSAVDIHIGTLSKAIGSVGGFVAGSGGIIEYLVNKARPFIFTTGLPPGAIAAAGSAIRVIERDSTLLKKLWANAELARSLLGTAGLDLFKSETPIIPILIGDSERALNISRKLLAEVNIYIPAIRPPAVPEGAARLRLTVCALHSQAELEEAAFHIIRLCREDGIID
ncbi:MAG: 8-amino-7-oxononanoate synthase [Pseudomonadota bacterium]